eukprot:3941950-Rhodomonas_salina.2
MTLCTCFAFASTMQCGTRLGTGNLVNTVSCGTKPGTIVPGGSREVQSRAQKRPAPASWLYGLSGTDAGYAPTRLSTLEQTLRSRTQVPPTLRPYACVPCHAGGGEAAARGRAPLPAGSSLFRCFSVAFLFPFFSPSFPCFRPAVFSLLVFLSSVAVSVSFSLNPVRGTLIFSRIARIRPRSNTSMHTSFLGRAHRKND